MTGVENRFYLGDTYEALGTPLFDLSRATFVGIGYYASHDQTDSMGRRVTVPGPYLHAYLTQDVYGPQLYAYEDIQLVGTTGFQPKILQFDAGAAFRPLFETNRWEFRVGWAGTYSDLLTHDLEKMLYVSIRFTY